MDFVEFAVEDGTISVSEVYADDGPIAADEMQVSRMVLKMKPHASDEEGE